MEISAYTRRVLGTLIVAGLVIALSIGCGGGGSSSSEGSGAGSSQATTSQGDASKSESAAESSTPGASAEFVGKGRNGKLAEYGEEADPAEREAASAVLEESLQARSKGDWAGQCATLAAPMIKQIEKGAAVLNAATGCAKDLEGQVSSVPEAVRATTMTGPIDVLRVENETGYAFYHGTKGQDWVIPMVKEGGEWKVASLQEQEAP